MFHYNDKKINLNKIKDSMEKKLALATEASGGCESLKKLLLELWNRDINTINCSCGYTEEHALPFIAISLTENRPLLKDVKQMFTTLINSFDEKILIMFSYHYFSVAFPKNSGKAFIKKCNEFFDIIYNSVLKFSKILDTTPKKEYIEALYSIIKEVFGYEGIYKISYKNDKFYLYENGKRKFILNEEEVKNKFNQCHEILDELKNGIVNSCTIKNKVKKN